MNELIFSYAEDVNGKMVHVDDVNNGLMCQCICPCCHEPLLARHGELREHGFAHHSKKRRANLKICYMVTMYKLAEQIISENRKLRTPSYYGIFKERDLEFTKVEIDGRYDRDDRQPDVIAFTADGEEYIIEFSFDGKIFHKNKIDYKSINCIEINLYSQTLETLHDFLLLSSADRNWLNNSNYFQKIENIYSQDNKLVKVKDILECKKCNFKSNNCCGIKPNKGDFEPITIRNNGHAYHICKTVEFEELKRREKEALYSQQKAFDETMRLRKLQAQIKIPHKQDPPSNVRRKDIKQEGTPIKQQLIEHQERESCPIEERSCFMCRRNLSWDCKKGYARCGIYENLGVPKNTPPDTAKKCRSFIQ